MSAKLAHTQYQESEYVEFPVFRDKVTGEFVSKQYFMDHPDTTHAQLVRRLRHYDNSGQFKIRGGHYG